MSRNLDRINKVLKNAERNESNFLNFYKWPDGATKLRILPAAPDGDEADWFYPIGQHFNIEEKTPVMCRYETAWAEDDCAICEMVKKLRADGMDQEARDYGLRRGFIIRAIIRGEEEKGAQLVRCPSTLFSQIAEMVRDSEDVGDVLDVGKNGVDIKVTKTGTGLGTKYSALPLAKTRPVLSSKKEFDAIVGEFDNFDEMSIFAVPSYEDQEKLLSDRLGYGASTMGDSADDDDDDGGGWENDDTPSAADDDDDMDLTADAEDDDDAFDGVQEEDDSWMDDEENDDDGDGDEFDIGALAEEATKDADAKAKTPPKKKAKGRTKKE